MLSPGAAITLLDAVYLPLHISGVSFKTIGYGLPRVRAAVCRRVPRPCGPTHAPTARTIMTIAIYHEHPDWFRPLFAELERRGLPYERLDAAAHCYDPGEASVPWSLVFNRASPSAYLRGARQTTFHTLHWLRHLERLGVPVVNGSATYALELSKVTQLDILAELGVRPV